ncbi:MAG: hypothetical protein L0Y67_08455 [Gammaproteobacteria bacterium]|nr:hypothetical protein [Gammaproteobacteria bacterium]MCI0591607.1 hypothetical protein [Gammaproteobacteria bacterium]
MTLESNSIPTKDTGKGKLVETRPIYVEEWLESLPYADFNRTSQLLQEALRATNIQSVKPLTRLELVQLYHRPYQYFIESHIKSSADRSLQSIEIAHMQVAAMKRIAVELAFACKLILNASSSKKSLWGTSKLPIDAVLLGMHYLSHVLVLSFQGYAPMPKNVWHELNSFYGLAEQHNEHTTFLDAPGDDRDKQTTIDRKYKQILLAAVSEPHQLPYGAIWEIYDQLDQWAAETHLGGFQPVKEASGYFVVDLMSDARPIPFVKFRFETTTDHHRLFDCRPLESIIQQHLERIRLGQDQDEALQFAPRYAKPLLSHLLKVWGLPPRRAFPREQSASIMEITCGINATYFYLNGQRDFAKESGNDKEDGEIIVQGKVKHHEVEHPPRDYSAENWNVINQGPSGFAVFQNTKLRQPVRIGELVGLKGPGHNGAENDWTLGIVRWLMIHKDMEHKLGIQILASKVRPGAVRALVGGKIDTEQRRAILAAAPEQDRAISLITTKGLYQEGRTLEITLGAETFQARADKLLMSTATLEQFSYKRV